MTNDDQLTKRQCYDRGQIIAKALLLEMDDKYIIDIINVWLAGTLIICGNISSQSLEGGVLFKTKLLESISKLDIDDIAKRGKEINEAH